jgi:HlyD family secretion protein
MKLKPGMTASIAITIDHRDGVLKVPNVALRYAPPGAAPGRVEDIESNDVVENSPDSTTSTTNPQILAPGQKWDPADKIKLDRSRTQKVRSGQVWLLTGNQKVEPRSLILGITDGVSTEVISGALQQGDPVIVGDSTQAVQDRPRTPTRNPLLPIPRYPGRRR